MITAFFFSQGAYAPSAQMSRQIGYYEEALSVRSFTILTSYQNMIKASGYNTGANNDQFAVYLQQTINNLKPGVYYSYAKALEGFYPGNKAPTVQTVAPWQMVGYLDTALALMQSSVVPAIGTTGAPAGINMCAGISNSSTYNGQAVWFPWSQKAAANGSDTSSFSLGATGPCSKVVAQASQPTNMSMFPLTKANFLGPAPTTAFGPYYGLYENLNGLSVNSFNGTVDRFFNYYNNGYYNNGSTTFSNLVLTNMVPSRYAPGRAAFGDVTLDQKAATGTCQQAPCNQLYQNPGQTYMG